jgi:hypothetical protein
MGKKMMMGEAMRVVFLFFCRLKRGEGNTFLKGA